MLAAAEAGLHVMEKDLNNDAVWKKIQQNTFTRWTNERLKCVDLSVNNMEKDFSDGVLLIKLVEVLSHKQISRYNKRPQLRSQKLENVSLALNFLEHEEKVHLVNIDSSDIVDQRLKLILGLIWTLILKYSISIPIYDDQEEDLQKETPKQRLMNWIQTKVPKNAVSVGNFTSDWKDGKALGALVDSCAPGLCPDWDGWQEKYGLENTTEAMNLADSWLGVAKLMEPQEFINPNVDEMSMMTYLSQYPNAKLKEGAPLRPKLSLDAIKVFGFGIETHKIPVDTPAEFFVKIPNFQSDTCKLEIAVVHGSGFVENVQTDYDEQSFTHRVTYTATRLGAYQIHLRCNGCDVPGSPFDVEAEKVLLDLYDVLVTGPGVEKSGCVVGSSTYFEVVTGVPKIKSCRVVIIDPNGQEYDGHVEKVTDNTFRCSYMTSVEGLYSVNVFLDSQPVPKSPFGVYVRPKFDSSKVTVWGRGLQPKGVRIGDTVAFTVCTKNASEEVGRLEVKVFAPDGNLLPVDVGRTSTEFTADFLYKPVVKGNHEVHVMYEDHPIPRSPFEVFVADASPSKVKAFGPGLQYGLENMPCTFTVDTCGESGSIGFSIEGPSQTIIECNDKLDGTADVTYTPTAAGHYAVHVLCADEDVQDSPFVTEVAPAQPALASHTIKCHGDGVTGPVEPNTRVEFKVDASQASKGELKTSVIGPDFKFIDCEIIDNGDQTFSCSYKPQILGRHFVMVTYGGIAIPDSPFRVVVQTKLPELSKLTISGPGSLDDIRSNTQTYFTLNSDVRIDGDLKIQLIDSNGSTVPSETKRDSEGRKVTTKFSLPKPGDYLAHLLLDGKELEHSPLKLTAKPGGVDTSLISVQVPTEEAVYVDSTNDVRVDCRLLPESATDHLKCLLREPSGNVKILKIEDNQDGTYKIQYTPTEEGRYELDLLYDGIPFSHSVFSSAVAQDGDKRTCLATGPGLRHGFVDVPANFVVETKGTTAGRLNISIEGPTETKINCIDQKDGSYLVNYVPTAPGDYKVSILWDQNHVNGSPFNVSVESPVDSSKVKAYGNGLVQHYIRPDVPLNFHIDASASGTAPLNVSVAPESSALERFPQIVDRGGNQYDVNYYAPDAQDFEVRITYGDKDIPNSPFKFNTLPTAAEPHKVRLLDKQGGEQIVPLGQVPASLPVKFTVDTTNAGSANLEVIVVGPDQLPYPVNVLDRENGLYDVSFIPDTTGPYSVVVKYGETDVPLTPYNFDAHAIGDASKCVIRDGQTDAVVIDESNRIVVNAEDAGPGAVTCRLTPESPAAQQQASDLVSQTTVAPPVDVQVSPADDDGLVLISYRIRRPDRYRIVIKFGGQTVPRGEWIVTAFNPDEFKAHDLAYDRYSGLREAGGDWTFQQKPEAGLNVNHLTRRDELTEYSYSSSTTTSTSTKFERQEDDRQKPFLDQPDASDLPTSAQLPVEYWNIQIPGSNQLLETFVKMPTGKIDLPTIKENHDGSVTIKYQPKESGLHEMHILYDKVHVQGSPFQFHVDAVHEGYVTAYGSGLIYGTVGEPSTFTVCVKDAGAGGLSVVVDGPAKAELQCHDNQDGTCAVSWLPPAPGEYKITVKFADKEIKGSPFFVRVAGESRKRAHISVGSTSEVSLKITEPDLKGMSASIKSPSGIEEPCFIRILDDGHLGISFTPRETGEHLVSVKKRNVLVPGAPFRIKVGENEVGNANKVKLTGTALERADTQMFNEFVVNTQQAGFGGLSVSIEGPSRCEIVCKENKDGICRVQYKPSEPGIYVLSVKFADHHVPGSPFTIKCQGAGAGTVRESVEQHRRPANVVFANQECQLCLKIPGTNAMDMSAKLTNPSHHTEDVELFDVSDSTYIVKFTPKELGLHTISVLHMENHISGSPFQFTVGPFQEGGAHKVRAGGAGLQRGEVMSPQSFNIYTREAGAGNLSIAIEGPSKAKIDFKDHKDGNCYVTYMVTAPGDYTVSIKFDDQHVPDSPFKVYILPSTGESRKLEVASFPDSGLPLNKPVTFTILTHGALGHLDAKVLGPSGTEDDCFITPIDEGESYAIRFVPKEEGNHYIHIRLDGIHMKASPFRVRVGGKEQYDPTAVTASGNGLKGGETGQKLEFIVNTCNAGAGLLAVNIDGPSKVTLDAYEVDVGYKVRYTPLAPGDYFMTIKFNGVHIPGSPFKVQIIGKTLGGSGYNESSHVHVNTVAKTGQGVDAAVAPKLKGDASLVQCKGMGLKKANLNRQNAFTVDCSMAGEDLLFAAVLTPKGPSDEVFIKHTGRGIYNVNYLIKQKGISFVFVKYGDRDVPGSPFPVEV